MNAEMAGKWMVNNVVIVPSLLYGDNICTCYRRHIDIIEKCHPQCFCSILTLTLDDKFTVHSHSPPALQISLFHSFLYFTHQSLALFVLSLSLVRTCPYHWRLFFWPFCTYCLMFWRGSSFQESILCTLWTSSNNIMSQWSQLHNNNHLHSLRLVYMTFFTSSSSSSSFLVDQQL